MVSEGVDAGRIHKLQNGDPDALQVGVFGGWLIGSKKLTKEVGSKLNDRGSLVRTLYSCFSGPK